MPLLARLARVRCFSGFCENHSNFSNSYFMILFAETDYQIAVSNESQIFKLLIAFQ